MTKLNLIQIAVLCAMPTGYRRAGFSLTKGDNSPLEVNQEQYDALEADKNLTVMILDADAVVSDIGQITSIIELRKKYELLLAEHNTLKNTAAELRAISFSQQNVISEHEETINLLEIEIANPAVITHEDTLADLAGVGDRTFGFDCSSAPEELHHWIAVIDDLNKEAPLTKKPNCDHLTITADGKEITPTGAERDAAWDWYKNNVAVAVASTVQTETGE
jgi:hypothetical protein